MMNQFGWLGADKDRLVKGFSLMFQPRLAKPVRDGGVFLAVADLFCSSFPV